MAHKREQKLKGDRISSRGTRMQAERHLRRDAEATGHQRGDMPDLPDQSSLEAAQDNTGDPRPIPTHRNRSGPNRKM